MIKTKIEDYLKKAVEKIIQSKFLVVDVFVPEKEEFGHYSTNSALKLAKILKKNLTEAAEEIKDKMLKIKNIGLFFTKIEVAAPGFINFWLSEKVLQDEMKEIFSDLPEAIITTNEIVNKIEPFKLERDVLLPKFEIPEEFLDPLDLVDKANAGEKPIFLFFSPL